MAYVLDETDKQILYELDKNSRIPETKLAKKVRKSKESVRYRVRRLRDEKVIRGFTAWIDPTKLGYQSAKIYLTLANIPKKKEEFINFVKKDKRLFWLGIGEGAWNAGLTYMVQSNSEFFEIKNKIFTKFQDLIIDSRTASLVNVRVHDKTFLYTGDTKWITMFEEGEIVEIDNISKKILKELFKNSRINITEIANKLKTTIEIVRNRMKNMENKKIIVKYTISIDYEKIGYEFFKTFLYFKNLSDEDLNLLMNHGLNNENIIHIVKQISPWDIELEVMCRNYKEYNKVISELTEKFSNIIRKVETTIIGENYVFPSKRIVYE